MNSTQTFIKMIDTSDSYPDSIRHKMEPKVERSLVEISDDGEPLDASSTEQDFQSKERIKVMPCFSSPGKRRGVLHIQKRFHHGTEVAPPRRFTIDEPTQATDERYTTFVPRNTMLSRTRQQLCKRNSTAQSQPVAQRNVKLQTESRSKNTAVTVVPMDFLGLFEKGTNYGKTDGNTMEKATQMYEHITQSELFCIEWIHRNLFEVKLGPNTLVVDDKIRDASETACVS